MDTKLSKNLSWLLRHGAIAEGLPIENDGFVDMQAVLSHKSFRHRNCTAADLLRVAENDRKGRYAIKQCSGRMFIKATQGHSIAVPDLSIRRVQSPAEIPVVIHGTYLRFWEQVKQQGLRRMRRNHIHFTASEIPSDSKVISGFRSDCEILVYVDVENAMKAGIEFFISENNVILSPGLDGSIPPRFFAKVVNRRTGKPISVV